MRELVGIKMRKLVLILICTCVLPFSIFAEEKKPTFTLDTNLSVYSSYMFRGLNLFDGPSIQPSVKANYYTEGNGDFHVNLWTHQRMDNARTGGNFSEYDVTFTYDYSFEDFTLSLGNVAIMYSDDIDISYPETSEMYLSIALDNTLLTPTFTTYHDYRAYDSQYYELLLSHRFEEPALWENFNITPYVNIGFASNSDKYFQKDGFIQGTVGILSDINAGPILVTPSINYTLPHEDVDDNQLWIGVSLSYTFE